LESQFSTYFQLGIEHILSFKAIDHFVFLVALCANYTLKDIKKVIFLATAFTVGHSLTLFLAVTNRIAPNYDLIEKLIPVTILLTALYNLFVLTRSNKPYFTGMKYFLIMFFGLIHGMGFSNMLINTLGQNLNKVKPLFSFNLGIELGQFFILGIVLMVSNFFFKEFKMHPKIWSTFVSGIAFGAAILMLTK
jgi:HupE / UreJ protein